MKNYLTAVSGILQHGYTNPPAREGMAATITSPTPIMLPFSLVNRFPIITTKEVPFKSIVGELLCFLKGYTNIKQFRSNKSNVWDDNAYAWYLYQCEKSNQIAMTKEDFIKFIDEQDENYGIDSDLTSYVPGDLGSIYSHYWRKAFGMDQLQNLIDNIINNPFERYHNVTAWTPDLKSKDITAQANCHIYFQVMVRNLTVENRIELLKRRLNVTELKLTNRDELGHLFYKYNIPSKGIALSIVQRSADMFLGVPFNISSYSLLTYIIAFLTNSIPLKMNWIGIDAHIYTNHKEQVKVQCKREPYTLPKLKVRLKDGEYKDFQDLLLHDRNDLSNLDVLLSMLDVDSFKLEGYQHHDKLKGELSVPNLLTK